jgi:ATP-dependent Clp protease ATP-binding subunit ClpC
LRRALQKYIEDPLSEALIQGSLPRPSEFEVYLGDSGIMCRQISGEGSEEEATVGAGGAAGGPVTTLYPF